MEGAQPSGEAYRPPLALRAALTAAMSRRSGSAGNGAVSSTDKGPEASVVSALSPRTSDSGACNLTVEDLLAHAALLVGPDGRCTTPHCPHGNPGAHPRRGTVASVSAETEASANARPASGESAPVASSHQGIASTLLSKVAAIKLERQRSTDNQLPSNQTRLERAVSDASPLAPAPVMSTSGQLRANFAQKFANKMREKAKEQKQKMASVGAENSNAPGDVAAQAKAAQEDPMWKALKEGDFEQFKREINADRRKATARGPVGELPVHVAFLYNSAKHMEIAKWLMAEFPETVSEVYVGDLYDGENLLHMSIVNKQNDMIKYLIEKDPGLIHGQATGSFFARPVEVEVGADAGNFYFGEYPLSLAACTNQKTVVQYLVEHGADLAAVDKNGNNVLHICVLHERMEMFSFVLGLWRSQQHPSTTLPLDKQRNCDNHTPITLCAEENKPKMLEFLINASKNHQWSYGSVSSDLYPLDEIDPLPSPEFTGAFEIIVNRANLDCLSVDFMMKLFNAKWAKYEGLFFKRFLSMLCLVLVFTLAVILNSDKATCRDIARAPLAVSTDAPPPPKGEELAALLAQCLDEHWISLFVRQVCEITVVIGVCYSAYLEQRKIRMSGFGSGVAFAQKLMGFGFIFCILSASVLRTMESAYEDVSIAIGSLVAWGYLLFFLLGFRLTGPFIVMLYRMFVLDVSRFSILIMVCFLGFAQAFYVLFDDHGFGLFFFRIKSMFLAMLGELDFEEYSQSEFPVLTVCLIVVFVIVVTIVLLNILVAMMSTTYSEVVEEAFHQWVLEASRIMLSLQKEMTPNEMKELLKKNPNFTESNGQRYLQIISKNADQYPLETPEQMETNRRELGF